MADREALLAEGEQRWCTCIADYTSRKRFDPLCPWHDIGEDVVDWVLGLEDEA